MNVPYLSAEEIGDLLSPAQAVAAIETAVRGGFDPASDIDRIPVAARHGQMLLMPSEVGTAFGVKLATVAPDNPALGLPRIHGVFVLFDGATLAPTMIFDGAALTTLRTPAVSIAAVKPVLLAGETPLRVVVFGAGPQAVGHVRTLAEVLRGVREIADVAYVVRKPVALTGLAGPRSRVERAGSEAARSAVAEADVIVCATSAAEPVFDSAPVRNDALVIAVGSHEPHVREVDSALCGRAQVVVEDVDTALRESGDVVLAIADGTLTADRLIPLREVILGSRGLDVDRPIFFKSSGMSWEDVVIAEAVAAGLARAT